jgi:hypothetical protein
MYHRLTHHHDNLTKTGVGRVHICSTRIIGRINSASFFPEDEAIRYDIPKGILHELLACVTPQQALRTLGQ